MMFNTMETARALHVYDTCSVGRPAHRRRWVVGGGWWVVHILTAGGGPVVGQWWAGGDILDIRPTAGCEPDVVDIENYWRL